jgi:hypothetical protein
MNDTLTAEEQKRVKRLIKRWRRNYALWYTLAASILFFISINISIPKEYKFIKSFILFWIPLMIAIHFLVRWTSRTFARGLTTEERDLILRTDPTSVNVIRFSELLHACKIDAPKEYLRASSPDQNDGTLLRAATHTDETHKAEMLRASNNPAE